MKSHKKYYRQTYLDECKIKQQKQKQKQKRNYINEDFKSDSDSSDKQNQIVTLMVKQNLILIMMNMTNNLLKVF